MWRSLCSTCLRFLSIAFLSSVPAWSQISSTEESFALESDGPVEVDLSTGETIAKKGSAKYGDWLIKADTIRYSKKEGTAIATGDVVLTRNDVRLIAEKVDFNLNANFARIENFRIGNGRGYIEGSLLEGDPNNFSFTDAAFYPGEPGTFLFKAKADRIALLDQKKFELDGLGFRLGVVPFPPLPNINYPVDADTNLFELDLDYSGHIGGVIGTELQLPITDHVRAGVNLALTTKRGFLFGPTAEYKYDDDQGNYTIGKLKTGFIDDSLADTDLDVLNRPIDDDRYFAEWQHLQRWGDRASISAYGRYWSDSEVTRDFHEDSFEEMEDPDSYFEANYNQDNWQLSLFARATPNDFQNVVERLPELTFAYFPTRVAKNWTQQGFISAAKLRQQSIFTFYDSSIDDWVGFQQSRETVDRLDAYYGLNFDKKLRDGVQFSAKAGARSTYHSKERTLLIDAPGGMQASRLSDDTRIFGDIGFDLKATAIATKQIDSDSWDIDAIRHVFEPVLSYRYTPLLEGDKNSRFAFPYDGPAVSNYLTPIDIEDRRDVDFIQENHKLRLAFNNRIQTRHDEHGSRDLARLDLALDYNLEKMAASANDFSDLHLDFELTPAPWIELRAFSRYNFENGDLEEINSTVALTDQGYWKLGVGNQYLRRSPLGPGFQQYIGFGEYTLSDNLKLFAVARYDEITSTFYEQSIGILQRALENYAIKYELRIYDGNRREEDFAIRIGIDLFNE